MGLGNSFWRWHLPGSLCRQGQAAGVRVLAALVAWINCKCRSGCWIPCVSKAKLWGPLYQHGQRLW